MSSVAWADRDGDGDPDLAVLSDPDHLQIFRNDSPHETVDTGTTATTSPTPPADTSDTGEAGPAPAPADPSAPANTRGCSCDQRPAGLAGWLAFVCGLAPIRARRTPRLVSTDAEDDGCDH